MNEAINVFVVIALLASIASIVIMLNIARKCDGEGTAPTIVCGVVAIVVSLFCAHDAFIFLCYHWLPLNYCPALRYESLIGGVLIFALLLIYQGIEKFNAGEMNADKGVHGL